MNLRLLPSVLALVVAASTLLPTAASASLIYVSTIQASAQGFGTAPRDLTLDATGNATTQSGGVGYSASGITFGTVIADSQVFMGNGISTLTGLAALPSPLEDNQKYGTPTTGALGITTASQIGVLFNATEPGGDSISVLDLTLKFYTSGGLLLGAIDGQQIFENSNAGNGVAGFTFVVDAIQQEFVNGLLAIGGAGTTLALESSFADFGGGPESFLIYNLGAPGGPGTGGPGNGTVPEPGTIALMIGGLGFMGFMARRRRRS